MQTPSYIRNLLQPTAKRDGSRKVWNIDLQYVWLPFFTATNVAGETAIPREAIGAPLRLAKDKDGSIKFSKTGRPVLRVAGEISDSIRLVRENFVASLVNYSGQVIKAQPDAYKAEAEACRIAGQPIIEKANAEITEAVLRKTEAQAPGEDRVPAVA